MTADLSNFDKQWSDAHFVSFLFYYYCKYRFNNTKIDKNKVDNTKDHTNLTIQVVQAVVGSRHPLPLWAAKSTMVVNFTTLVKVLSCARKDRAHEYKVAF